MGLITESFSKRKLPVIYWQWDIGIERLHTKFENSKGKKKCLNHTVKSNRKIRFTSP